MWGSHKPWKFAFQEEDVCSSIFNYFDGFWSTSSFLEKRVNFSLALTHRQVFVSKGPFRSARKFFDHVVVTSPPTFWPLHLHRHRDWWRTLASDSSRTQLLLWHRTCTRTRTRFVAIFLLFVCKWRNVADVAKFPNSPFSFNRSSLWNGQVKSDI